MTDWQAYPAAELAACYPDRWAAVVLAAAAELASQRILARLLPVRPPRHREPRTKCRQQFPSATG